MEKEKTAPTSQDVEEETGQAGAREQTRIERKSEQYEQRQTAPRPIQLIELNPQTGPSLQIHGDVMHSQIRQSSSTLPQMPPTSKAVPRESQTTQRATTTTIGSAQRKRSRVGEEGGHSVAQQQVTKIHEHVNLMNSFIESLQKLGPRGNTGLVRVQMSESMKEIMAETTSLLARMVNLQELLHQQTKAEKLIKDKLIILQEENNNVKQQVIDLQLKTLQREQEEKANVPLSYVQATTKHMANGIITGKQIPLPQVPQSIKQAPSECIIIYKAKEKGTMATKTEQEKFRKELRDGLGGEEMQGISVIRPTRFGGYTLICQNERVRNMVYEKIRANEISKGINENEISILAPTKRVAKVVCKEVPEGISIEQIKKDMFDRHNPILQAVNNEYRTGKIYHTRLGLIFELSSQEMAAIQRQGWRIRCDVAREIRVEEFISLQQCYACAKFGHSANECKAGEEVCRLCGEKGHAGKDCPKKDDKENWRCANCKRMNILKNLKLDEHHAAAQLHKCPVAQQQKNIRKIQMASTGVFTTPINRDDDVLKERPKDTNEARRTNGAHREKMQMEGRRRNRSRSIKSNNDGRTNNSRAQTANKVREIMRNTRGEQERRQEGNLNEQRTIKIPKPQTTDGWQTVGRKNGGKSDNSWIGRDNLTQESVRGSGEEMEVEEEEEMEMTQRPNETILLNEDE